MTDRARRLARRGLALGVAALLTQVGCAIGWAQDTPWPAIQPLVAGDLIGTLLAILGVGWSAIASQERLTLPVVIAWLANTLALVADPQPHVVTILCGR